MTTIPIDGEILGMPIRRKTIYYCTENKGITMISLTNKSVSDIISSNKSDVIYVATSGNKLYYTGSYTHTVTCCDLHGTNQWELICHNQAHMGMTSHPWKTIVVYDIVHQER
jgi:hypothetical protein